MPSCSRRTGGRLSVNRWVDQAELSRVTGIVIPAYFSAKPSDEVVHHLLWITLGDCHHYVPLENVLVVVDGDPRTTRLLQGIRERLLREQGDAFCITPLPENRGKLWAIREGVSALLRAKPHLDYLVIRDGDGDHAASDIPPLVRTAICLTEAYQTSRTIVIGSRRSRHRPMGWLRGEMEALLDQITLDALAYHLAREGRVLNLRHCLGDAVPDLSSGYKVYGRPIAQELFIEDEPEMASLSSEDYWHYGPETVTVVEALLKGAVIAEKQRLTWDGQPATSFGDFQHVSLYGELLAWIYARLRIPLEIAAQFYDNHAPQMSLRTTAHGRELLAAVRRCALEKVSRFRGESMAIPEPKPILPFL